MCVSHSQSRLFFSLSSKDKGRLKWEERIWKAVKYTRVALCTTSSVDLFFSPLFRVYVSVLFYICIGQMSELCSLKSSELQITAYKRHDNLPQPHLCLSLSMIHLKWAWSDKANPVLLTPSLFKPVVKQNRHNFSLCWEAAALNKQCSRYCTCTARLTAYS